MDESSVLSLVDRIYAAGEDRSQWPLFLEDLSEQLDGRMTGIFHHDTSDAGSHVAAIVRADPDYQRLYDEYYAARNVFFVGKESLTRSGMVVTGDYLCEEEEILASEYYNDFLRPQNGRYGAGVILNVEQPVLSFLSTMHDEKAGRFGRDELRLLEILTPHLQRAFQLHRRLIAVEGERDRLLDLLDSYRFGVILVDARGLVIRMNSAASEITRRRDGIWCERGELRAPRAEETERLRKLIGETLRSSVDPTLSGGALSLPRRDDSRPYTLVGTPLGSDSAFGAASVALFITDPDAELRLRVDWLCNVWGLTRSEAQVACVVAEGRSAVATAAQLGIRESTVRTHLKRVFAKTETESQSALAALIASSAVAIAAVPAKAKSKK